jgi:hypothetical protein
MRHTGLNYWQSQALYPLDLLALLQDGAKQLVAIFTTIIKKVKRRVHS